MFNRKPKTEIPSPREAVNHVLKRELINRHTDLSSARARLEADKANIEQQISEHNSAINAVVSALTAFEMEDRVADELLSLDFEDTFIEDELDAPFDPSSSDGYNGGAGNALVEKL